MSDLLLAAYREKVLSGELHEDPVQEQAIKRLELLLVGFGQYVQRDKWTVWRRKIGLGGGNSDVVPKGLYIFGAVGRGKSFLMDLFYVSVDDQKKRRVHFHEFMLEIHSMMHEWRNKEKKISQPLRRIAKELASQTWLLCFDEFHVDNIADAMILGRLFEALFEEGVVIVATSNEHPDNLYEHGLQRDRFIPFIEILKNHVDIIKLEARRDYRRDRLGNSGVYHTPLDGNSNIALDKAFLALTDGSDGKPLKLRVMGRQLTVPNAVRGVARFSFKDLCEQPLGSADYIAIAKRFHTLILANVPVMPPEKRNEAKRFVTLIDTLYEFKVNIILSAAAEPDELCVSGTTAISFQRTTSRLIEMQSEAYIENAKNV